MMHRLGSPTRLNRISRIAQILRRSAARPSFLPKVFLSLVLIATGLFMVASDSATYASPRTAKNGGVAGISPTSNSNSSASIVIMDTTTPTQTATSGTVTPTATHVSNTIPTSSYTSSAANTTTPTVTSISGTPTPTATSIGSTPTPTPTATTTSSTSTTYATDTPTPTATNTGSEDNDEDETPTATATSVDTETPTATATTTITATATNTSTVTPTVTNTSTVTPTVTVTPTDTPTPITGCVTSTTSSAATAAATTNAKRNSPAVASPLLFGTNLALFNNQDQVLTSQSAQDCLQQMHISIIRVPTRSGVDEATIQQAAQTVQQIGATPLIVLHGSVDTGAYQDDATIIQDMNTIFGNSTVYYEYGNNEDLLRVSAKKYTDSWNANVPGLKKLALNGQFIGPVTYQYRPNYLQYFLQNASPQPDAISWHEYACSRTQGDSTCFASLKGWANHVHDARSLMEGTIRTVLPIMITEWNYAPDTIVNDGKNNDATFMSTWTTQALQTLANSGVTAAMQYAATNTNTNLIDSTNTLTTQGSTMQLEYETLVPSSSSSGTASATPTLTPTPTATATPVSVTSAEATPSNATITPSSSAVSASE